MSSTLSKSKHSIPCLFTLENVVDANATLDCCLALCTPDYDILCMIITHWTRTYSISDDTASVITLFSKSNTVYSTTYHFGSRYPMTYKLPFANGWSEIKYFKENNISITKITCGRYHSLLLDDRGDVYVSGSYDSGNIGIDQDKFDYWEPDIIPYFKENGIKIKDISSGYRHNLAVDIEGRIYSWGDNYSRQCGHELLGPSLHGDFIEEPRMIESLKEYVVVVTKCGYSHSYCKTDGGKHFLWGHNRYRECVSDEREEESESVQVYKNVAEPFMINDVIEEEYDGAEIVDVSLGYHNTKIIIDC